MKIEINVNTQETNQEITKYAEGFEKLLKSITIDTGNAIKRIQDAEQGLCKSSMKTQRFTHE